MLTNNADMDPEIFRILNTINFYEILIVDRKADQSTIRRSYVHLARKVHPDKWNNSKNATTAFQKIANAYDVLGNSQKRMMYDVSAKTSGGSTPTNFNNIDAEEILWKAFQQMYEEFLNGDYETIMMFVDHINELAKQQQRQANPHRHSSNEKIEDFIKKEDVKRKIQAWSKYINSCRKFPKEAWAGMSRFFMIYDTFRSLRFYQVFGRIQLGIEMVRVLCSIPPQTSYFKAHVPNVINSCFNLTVTSLEYTQSWIGKGPIDNYDVPNNPKGMKD